MHGIWRISQSLYVKDNLTATIISFIIVSLLLYFDQTYFMVQFILITIFRKDNPVDGTFRCIY